MRSFENTEFNFNKIDELRKQLSGKVLTPDTSEYEQSRISWNLLADQHPALIIEVTNVQDVVYAVKFAEDNGLKVAVQSTGHGTLFQSDGQLLIKTSRMKNIRMNLSDQTVHLEAGAVWGDVIKVTQAEGLVPLSGFAPSVGVVGFTLNGGYGWLTRKFGLAADSLLAVEMVTMDGRLLTITPEINPELFWALAGGGPLFGIVTAIQVRLYPVSQVYGGKVIFPLTRAKEIIAAYCEWTQALPDDFTTMLKLAPLSQNPELPEAFHGKMGLVILGCCLGDEVQGDKFFASLKALEPLLTKTGMMPYSALAELSEEPPGPLKLYVRNESFNEITEGFADHFAELIESLNDRPAIIEFRHVDSNAVAKSTNSSAVSHRDTVAVLNLIIPLKPDENYGDGEKVALAALNQLAGFSSGNTLPNFLFYGDNINRVKTAYDENTFEKLLTLKTKLDPDQRLMSNLMEL